MTITYDFSLGNPNLPVVKTVAEQVLDLPGLLNWYQAQSDFLTMSSATSIQTWHDRAGGEEYFGQATAFKRAALTADSIGTWDAAVFTRADQDHYVESVTRDLTGTIAAAVVWRPRLSGVSQGILSALADASTRFGAQVTSGGSGQVYCGNATSTFAITQNVWQVLIFEKTSTVLQVRNGGVTVAEVAHNNSVPSLPLVLGAIGTASSPCEGDIADVMLFGGRVIGNAAAMSAINDYTTTMYGVSA